MIDKIRGAIKALQYGEELSNAATWKNRQNLLNTLVAFIGAVAVFFPEATGISDQDIIAISGGIAAVAGLFNNYLTTATSAKIGLQTSSGTNDSRQDTST